MVYALKRQVKNMEKGQVIAFNFHKGFGLIKLLKSGDIVSVPINEITGNEKYLVNGEIVECGEIGGIGEQGIQPAKQVKRTVIQGQVKKYSSNNGFGWIQRFDNQRDIGVHFTSLRDAGYKTLHEGDIVEFVEGLNTQGELLNTQGHHTQGAIALDVVVVSSALKIETFSLTGFKAFDTTVSLPIRPVTILAGLNSHGKSSIIHALLLLKQTLLAEKRVSGRLVLEWSGPFFQINELVELVHNKEEEKSFTLSFEIPSKLNNLSEHTKAILPAVQNNAGYVEVGFTFTPVVSQGRTIRVSLKVSLSVLTSSVLEEKNQTPLIKLEIDDLERKVKYQDKEFDCGKTLTFSYFLPIWEERPPELLTIKDDPEFETAKRRYEVYSIYQDLFQPAIEVIQQELWHNLKYLGPLRSEPQREYSVGKLLHKDDIGKTGENAVVLLYQNWHEKINFVVLPQDRTQVISWHELSFKEIEVGVAINESLRWLGMQELKIIEKVPGLLIQAIFPTSLSQKTWVTIADIGFGVSQILPVLAMGLLAEPDSILIFEQPEIHLHPRAQARLAELLVCFAYLGKRIIIETHSDHLINRLRRLVAEDLTDQLCDKVGIMFVQQDGKGAKIEALRVDKEGLIENWPDGFLAETAEDSEAIIRAGIAKWPN